MDQIASADQPDLSALRPPERDLRLDLFRGVGQWMVFLDHIPHDLVSWLILAAHVLARRDAPKVFRATFSRLTIRTEEDQLWELDGEVIGTTRKLVIAVNHEKVRLRVPARPKPGIILTDLAKSRAGTVDVTASGEM